ncbi:IS110 family transposase [Desulforhabdus amnigena]|jgi:transposase|uniref:IS110 family transposase n=1 Tax=Desulforhabdus amnigena TaxID=40218 RepID=A0A9W6CVN5_9BACT|nr:IS110 family transposase [Desulforhabdus amnigena]GLI33030.1 IS110 family transposase [Desulforhabdus amnigena]GLI33389.1 IS110 family transposase [Desulforhabdus amnigena]GLI33390.1 IS110 family transposase [Desulforhabdus amnigena]GLI35740.1 IS110 family transposase [Desulforhabdus amnigena]GLI36453.1 IS110 family transposase [Desulforhabdus amnigena]
MELEPIHKSAIGLDVHQKHVTACLIAEQEDGSIHTETLTFGTFKRDRRALARWARDANPEIVVMESTGIYWKSIYSALEREGIVAAVVNARHVKQVPGRKTDVADSRWLAMLARCGLLRGSFIPPEELGNLRLISRERQKLVGMLASEKNRLHKVLTDGGIRLSVVVSDIHGQAARHMIECLIEGGTPLQALEFANSRLKATPEELLDALDGDLTPAHRFVLREILQHIRELEARIARFDTQLLAELESHRWALDLLQTIPGIDAVGAAMLIVEIGLDMEAFGSPQRLASWAGVCPGNNESAGKRKSGRIRKGNPYVRRLLCEMANAARRTKSMFQSKYSGLVIRRGHKRAIIALAHKILKIVFILLSRRVPYRDSQVDYKELMVQRNAPRWIAALRQYHMLPTAI